jgi:hypothetical protein
MIHIILQVKGGIDKWFQERMEQYEPKLRMIKDGDATFVF